MKLTRTFCPATTRRLAIGVATLAIGLVGASELRASERARTGDDGAAYAVPHQSETLRHAASGKAYSRRDRIEWLNDWLAEFRAAATNGDGVATYELGRLLLAGPPEVKNHEEGLRWLKSVPTQSFRIEGAAIVIAVLSEFFVTCETMFRAPRKTTELESFARDIDAARPYGPDVGFVERYRFFQSLLIGTRLASLGEIDPAYASAWVACARAHDVPWAHIEVLLDPGLSAELSSAIADAVKALKP